MWPRSSAPTGRCRRSWRSSARAASDRCARPATAVTTESADPPRSPGRPVDNDGQGSAPLGILACAGPLPIEVAEATVKRGRSVHIVAIDGFASDHIARYPHDRVSLGQVGRMLQSFHRAGVCEIVIAGAMQRPDLTSLKVDLGFWRNLPTVLTLTRGGDDSVLRRVVRFFEGHGLGVVGVADVAPDLLAPAGPLGVRAPDAPETRALARAAGLIAALGPFDVGQAVVATGDRIIAVEGVRGTDAMLRDLGPGGIGMGLGKGAVLAKLAKPGQEMRIDLPTIGTETVARAKVASLAGIGVGTGGAIVLERAQVAAAADAAGLFVTGIEPAVLLGDAPGDAASAAIPAAITDAGELTLELVGRRAPTPTDRRDIAIGRELAHVLRANAAGRGAIIAREHVTAISGSLPLAPFVIAQGRPTSWGWRLLKGRIGVLMVDARAPFPDASSVGDASLDADLFRAAMEAGLAGIVHLGPIGTGERRRQITEWANEAGLFLMAGASPA
ncbi:MAG: UDP-2,3-diacylglucosamine diphosphatase LpxI [Hyphomicrobiaceae bacterium]|nr:UDP-2,3-diacylglucosamine diphosphatase LpxI [Hyphomicrobiaceae bacterium]